MDYSCGLGPHLSASTKRSSNIRRTLSSSKHIGGIDWHLRVTFGDQIKCLDNKLDVNCIVLAELQEFYRRRAIVEQEYADSLAKLVNNLKQKHINDTVKRPYWAPYTITTIWNTLLGSTLHLSEAHATLADIFSQQMVQRLVDMCEDATRLHKQCREMMLGCQERVLANTNKLQTDHQKYAQKHVALLEASRILNRTEDKMAAARLKAQGKGKSPENSQRFQRTQSEYDSKHASYVNAMFAATRARNDYCLQLAATNSSVQRYIAQEALDVIDCLDVGFHNSLARSTMMHLSCEEALKSCHSCIVEMLNRNITALDSRQDKESRILATGPVRIELETKALKLSTNIERLRVSTDEIWKTLEEVEKRFLELVNQKDYDVSSLFCIEKPRSRRTNANHLFNSTTTVSLSASPGGAPASGPRSTSPALSISGADSAHSSTTDSPMISVSNESSQSRVYMELRLMFRSVRIEHEKFYIEQFVHYTDQMHQHQLMQVQLKEIEKTLAMCLSDPSLLKTQSPNPIASRESRQSTPKSRICHTGVPVLPIKLLSNNLAHMFGSGDEDGSLLSPPPPPPIPQTSLANYTHSPGSMVSSSTEFSWGSTPSFAISPPAGHKVAKIHTRRVLRVPNVGKPKLFGGTLDEYVASTQQPIPVVILSCTRVINEYGMRHQGIFRVSGSQADINEFKDAFERGEDPLVVIHDARDINTTAGLLKLYFRELGEPPFPNSIFLELISCVRENKGVDDMIQRLRQVITENLSRPVFVVMRYLFGFLNHVSQFSEDNMMDSYNLAICFGPTLMPVPHDLDQVHYQPSVIDLIKNFIVYHLVIFNQLFPGPVYDKNAHSKPPASSNDRIAQVTGHASVSRSNSASSSPSVRQHQFHANEDDDGVGNLKKVAFQGLPKNVPETATTKPKFNPRFSQIENADADGTKECPKSASTNDIHSAAKQCTNNSSDDEYASGDDGQSLSDSEDDFATPYTVAIAQADFHGTTKRELSFKQNDEIFLYRQLNPHWWEGQLASDNSCTRGLIPHLYVVPKSTFGHFDGQTNTDDDNKPTPSDDSLENLVDAAGDGERQRSSLEDLVDGSSTDSKIKSTVGDANDKSIKDASQVQLDKHEQDNRTRDDKINLTDDSPTSSHSTPVEIKSNAVSNRTNLRHTVSYPISASLGSVPENDVIRTNSNNLSSPTSHGDRPIGGGSQPSKSESPARFSLDSEVDSALFEVMRNLTSLADTQNSDFRIIERNQELTRKFRLPSAKYAPDLVMDLPVNTNNDNISPSSILDGDAAADNQKDSSKSYLGAVDQNNSTTDETSLTMHKRPKLRISSSLSIPVNSVIKPPHFNSDEAADFARPKLRHRSPPGDNSTNTSELSNESLPRLSIAARVAAFEANKSDVANRTSLNSNPTVAPKPKRT